MISSDILSNKISSENYFNPALETGKFRHKRTLYFRAENSAVPIQINGMTCEGKKTF